MFVHNSQQLLVRRWKHDDFCSLQSLSQPMTGSSKTILVTRSLRLKVWRATVGFLQKDFLLLSSCLTAPTVVLYSFVLAFLALVFHFVHSSFTLCCVLYPNLARHIIFPPELLRYSVPGVRFIGASKVPMSVNGCLSLCIGPDWVYPGCVLDNQKWVDGNSHYQYMCKCLDSEGTQENQLEN